MSQPGCDPLAVLDRLPASVFRLDRDARVEFANRWVCDQLGVSPDRVVGKTCLDLGMPTDEWTGWKAAVDETFATGRTGQHEFLHRDGDERLVECRFAPEPGADGGVRSVWVVAVTVTEVHRLRVALREQEQLFRAFLDRAPAIAWLRDAAGRYVFVNQTYLTHYRLTAEDRIGKTPAEVWPADIAAQFRANDQAVFDAGREVRVIETAPEPGGGHRHWLNVKFPFGGETGRRFIGGIGVDVTDQRADDERAAKAARLESLGLLAAGAAHDFNNLLTVMLGQAALAARELPAQSVAGERLRTVLDAGERAAELCRQMLAFAGRVENRPQATDLASIARDTAGIARTLLPKSAALHLDLPPDPLVVFADPTHLRQVVLNLLTNAGDAMTGRTGDIRVRVAGEPGRVVLTVSDQGCGMPPEVAARVFEPFFTTKPHGRGLGLAAVHGLVRALGGEITVQSEVDVGSTFRVQLPAG